MSEPDWTSEKPFAGPDDPVTSTCWDCGATWRRGESGHHSCVAHLKTHALRLAEEVERLKGPAMPSGLPGWEETDHAYVDGRNEGRRDERARIRRELLEALPGIEAGVAMLLDDRLTEGRMAPDLLVTDNRTVLHEEVFGGVYAAIARIVPGEG